MLLRLPSQRQNDRIRYKTVWMTWLSFCQLRRQVSTFLGTAMRFCGLLWIISSSDLPMHGQAGGAGSLPD